MEQRRPHRPAGFAPTPTPEAGEGRARGCGARAGRWRRGLDLAGPGGGREWAGWGWERTRHRLARRTGGRNRADWPAPNCGSPSRGSRPAGGLGVPCSPRLTSSFPSLRTPRRGHGGAEVQVLSWPVLGGLPAARGDGVPVHRGAVPLPHQPAPSAWAPTRSPAVRAGSAARGGGASEGRRGGRWHRGVQLLPLCTLRPGLNAGTRSAWWWAAGCAPTPGSGSCGALGRCRCWRCMD